MNVQPPLATRPLRRLVLAAAEVVRDDAYLDMTEDQFVGAVMRAAGGAANPKVVQVLCADLLRDAGVAR